jgi:hypothetical protein
MKQNETLEEAAENYNLNTINAFGDYESFIAGAKWQQERSYSEEDMINFVQFATQYYANDWMENRSIYELLEQFKNK